MDLHVLIVEDSEDDALLEIRELRKGGFAPRFERIQTAEEMQAAMGRQRWDVLLVDYALPEFSGPAALALAQKLDQDLPAIIVSGKIGEETAVACMKSGARDYILKGNLQRLSAVVERELRETESRRERRRLEQEIRNSQERLDLALRGSGTGIWDLDVATNALVLSETWKSMLGLAADEGPGTFQELLDFVHSGDRDRYRETIEAQRAGATGEVSLEHRLRHKNGTYRWFLCQGRFVDHTGARTRLVGTYVDVTERRRMDLQVRRLERLFSVGQLLGGMAHELNNPLFILTGQLQLLQEKLAQETPARYHADMQTIRSTTGRLKSIVERFLSLSTPWTQQIRHSSVATTLANALDLLKDDLTSEIQTDVRVDPDLPEIMCDPRSLREVFINLILNAIHAMVKTRGRGKLTVTAALSDGGAETRNRDSADIGRWIEVRIQDDGPGIAPEYRAKMFEPFVSANAPEDGPGLGLWTVRTLLFTMRGRATCESEVGRGTTFIVWLPVADKQAPADQPLSRTLSAT